MSALIVIAVLVVVVVIASPWLRRARHDRRTARDYHRMLETLGHLSPERSGVPPGTLSGSPATQAGSAEAGAVRSVRLPGGAPPAFGLQFGGATMITRRRRGPSRLWAVVVAVVVLAVGGAVGVVVLTGHQGVRPAAGPPALPRRTAASSAPKPAVPKVSTPKAPPTAPSTAPVTVAPYTLISNGADTSVYQLTGAASITLHAVGECWVEIHSTDATGPTVYTALMTAGQTETVSAPVWIRLGAPAAVAVEVSGSPLPAAGTGADPYDLELQ